MLEMDQGRCGHGSPAEMAMEMAKWKEMQQMQAHIQILRIRAEDSHLGEDIGEGSLCLSLKDKFGLTHFLLFSRPLLPASPLGVAVAAAAAAGDRRRDAH